MNVNTSLALLKKSPLWLRIVLGVLLISLVVWWIIPDKTSNIPTAVVKLGEFVIDLKETGRLRAENSVTVTAPPVRSNLQIIYLVEEGTVVEKGDLLIQFDSTDMQQQIDDQQAELDIAESNLSSSLVSMASKMSDLKANVENLRASYRLSELRLEQMKFESDVQIEEAKLNLLQSEISLRRAEEDIASQLQIDSAEVRSLKLKIRQAEIDMDKARRDLEKLTVKAPAPGLVVYKETWKGSEMAKIKVGDTPWRGMALIELPDLSIMMVETTVSEVDVGKVKVDQAVEVKLDAYPDPTFYGKVVDVAVLAKDSEGGSQAKVFDVMIRLDLSDPVQRPGMTATSKIIIDKQPNMLWIPIEAVFYHEDKSVVWKSTAMGWERVSVELGARNDNFVVINSGLKENDRVALVDPTIDREELEKGSLSSSDKSQSSNSTSKSSEGNNRPRRRRG